MIIALSMGLKGQAGVGWGIHHFVSRMSVVSAISSSNQQVVSNNFTFLFYCSFCACLVSDTSS